MKRNPENTTFGATTKRAERPLFIARVRNNGSTQSLEAYLSGVATLTESFARKLGLSTQGELIGLPRYGRKYEDEVQGSRFK